ncbi:hypothetical protein ACLOJK_001953 [Asimina triloba]
MPGVDYKETKLDSSTSPSSGEIMACPRPALERRLRPQHDQALKCPRCDSTNTKFCYYNNYSLSQPRYFCKTCRRYWTKGGSLRNVPVGGGCRKSKKAATKKPHDPLANQNRNIVPPNDATDLHLSFSGVQLSHLNDMLVGGLANANFMCGYDPMLSNPGYSDFMEVTKHDGGGGSGAVASHGKYGCMDGADLRLLMSGQDDIMSYGFTSPSLHGSCTPLGFSLDESHGTYLDNVGERLLQPFGGNEDPNSVIDVKPISNKLFSLEWQEQGCTGAGRDALGYLMNGLGSWPGLMNSYGSSTANPLL